MALSSTRPLELVGQQASFHVEFLVDFVATGAQLFGRQLAIPGTVLQDLQNGRPLPVAVGRALQTFAEIELDAGRELVGFAEEHVAFQARFFADLFSAPFLRDVVVSVAAVPIAAARVVLALADAAVRLLGSVLTGPEPATRTVFPSAPTSNTTPPESTGDDATSRSADVATTPRSDERAAATVDDSVSTASTDKEPAEDQPKKPKLVVESADSDTAATVSAQGEVRSGTTDTNEAGTAADTKRDDTAEATTDGADDRRGEHDTEPKGTGDKDDAAQSDSVNKTGQHA